MARDGQLLSEMSAPAEHHHHPAFYPLLGLTALAVLCEVILVLGAVVGKFSWKFAVIWMVLLLFHMTNIAVLARRSR